MSHILLSRGENPIILCSFARRSRHDRFGVTAALPSLSPLSPLGFSNRWIIFSRRLHTARIHPNKSNERERGRPVTLARGVTIVRFSVFSLPRSRRADSPFATASCDCDEQIDPTGRITVPVQTTLDHT